MADRQRELTAAWRAEQRKSPVGLLRLALRMLGRWTRFLLDRGWRLWVNTWFRVGWRWRGLMVVGGGLSMLIIVGLLANGASTVVGGGGTSTPSGWRAPPAIVKSLDRAVSASVGRTVTVRSAGLSATWYAAGVLVVNPARGPRRLTDEEGTLWQEGNGCWTVADRGMGRPVLEDILLPLDPRRTVWSGTPSAAGFKADRLGSWGRGSGTARFSGDRLSAFSYTPTGGERFTFTVTDQDPLDPPTVNACG